MSEPKIKGLGELEAHTAEAKRRDNLETLKSKPTYVVRSAAEVLSANPVEPIEVWGGICLDSEITEIIGASGIGKSRIILDLAVKQCLAAPLSRFFGITYPGISKKPRKMGVKKFYVPSEIT